MAHYNNIHKHWWNISLTMSCTYIYIYNENYIWIQPQAYAVFYLTLFIMESAGIIYLSIYLSLHLFICAVFCLTVTLFIMETSVNTQTSEWTPPVRHYEFIQHKVNVRQLAVCILTSAVVLCSDWSTESIHRFAKLQQQLDCCMCNTVMIPASENLAMKPIIVREYHGIG